MRVIVTLCLLFCTVVAHAASPAMRNPSAPTLQTSQVAARLHSQKARDAQHHALRAMPKVQVQYEGDGRVKFVEGSTAIVIAASRLQRSDRAEAFLRDLAPVLMATPADGLRVMDIEDRRTRSNGRELGGHDVFLEQTVHGLPVVDAGVNVRTNEAGEVIVISSRFVPGGAVSDSPAMSREAVKKRLLRDVVDGGIATKGSISFEDDGELAYFTDGGKLERPVLIWLFQASFRDRAGQSQLATLFADATTGALRGLRPDSFEMRRVVWSLLGSPVYGDPWTLLWDEWPPNYGNPHAVTMYNNVPRVRDMWASLGWNYDTVNVVADWGDHNNALYATRGGVHSIIAGDNVALEPDTVAHEYGHGVFVERAPSAPWFRYADWYAINEFWADLSSVFTDLAQRGGQDTADTWLISALNGYPLRDLSFPKSPLIYQPAYQDYRDFYPKRSFCCFPSVVSHRNMTIYGHALYLLKHGGVHSRAGQRWSTYVWPFQSDTIPVIPITPTDTETLKQVFVQGLANMRLYGAPVDGPNLKAYTSWVASTLGGSTLATNVSNAWTAVGIGHGCSGPPAVPSYNFSSHYCRGRYDMDWPQEPGVTYHAQVAPIHYSLDVYGQTVTDGEVNQCNVNVPGRSFWRLRACNACGCSAWTPEEFLEFYRPCL